MINEIFKVYVMFSGYLSRWQTEQGLRGSHHTSHSLHTLTSQLCSVLHGLSPEAGLSPDIYRRMQLVQFVFMCQGRGGN